ncbi:unnamed protein product, partial [Brenthis ino]
MFPKTLAILSTVMLIQIITGQSIRQYNSAYNNEIAANIADAAAGVLYPGISYPGQVLAPGANAMSYAPDAALIGINGLSYGLTLAELSASRGCSLKARSSSLIAPNGVTVETDKMAIEGPLAVSGQLPFLGVVSLEGQLPAAGEGAVTYSCGNGDVGIVSEGVEAVVPSYPNIAPGYLNTGYPTGLGPLY